ncbi:MAG: GTPase ObgE [Ignavibacteriaceae bacterium]|nr:GTPase ObgE [Ignavibacteriaceae bacterium]
MFIDQAEIEVKAGNGGDGAVTFRREKYVPKGGPSGGNGGKGGDVIIQAFSNLNTLLDFKYKRRYFAGNGALGGNSLKDGRNGANVLIKVPVGTIVKDFENGKNIADLDKEGKKIVIAKGGRGGKGNSNFATSTNQAPRFAEKGKPGEFKKIILELKLIADVGIVGFPNAGKSTLISVISSAKPKIADYPFTTLEPNLGIVHYKDFKSFTVADIPGIIEGAHKGKGLGLKFLRHIERTKILLFLIEITSQDIERDFNILLNETKQYSKKLTEHKKIIALSKSDLVDEQTIKKISRQKFFKGKNTILIISSATRQGIDTLLEKLCELLNEHN